MDNKLNMFEEDSGAVPKVGKKLKEHYKTLPKNIIQELRESIENSILSISDGFSKVAKLLVYINDFQEGHSQILEQKKKFLKINTWKTTLNNLTLRVEGHFDELNRRLLNIFPEILRQSSPDFITTLDRIYPSSESSLESMFDLLIESQNSIRDYFFNLKASQYSESKSGTQIKKRPDGGAHVISNSTKTKPTSFKQKTIIRERIKFITKTQPISKEKVNTPTKMWKTKIISLSLANEKSIFVYKVDLGKITCIDAISSKHIIFGTDTGEIIEAMPNENKEDFCYDFEILTSNNFSLKALAENSKIWGISHDYEKNILFITDKGELMRIRCRDNIYGETEILYKFELKSQYNRRKILANSQRVWKAT